MLLLDSPLLLPQSFRWRSLLRGGEEEDEAKATVVLVEEEYGAARRLCFRWRLFLQWTAMSGTSPSSSSSAYTSA